MDDGTVSRLGDDRWFLTTTTANAAKVMQHIDFTAQVLWPELDVQAVSVTEQWATYAVAGPGSRALLQRRLPHMDLSNQAFPYMAVREINWEGLPARLFRLSFSGELAFEIAVPANHGDELIRALTADGGVIPYGTEALSVMRIEKGHPAGNELNGQTTAHDLGLGRLLSTRKDFIGRAMALRPALTDPARPTLVGLRPAKGQLRAGAHLLAIGAAAVAANDQGYVTSVAFSPSLDGWIGLALLRHGAARHGERLRAYDPVRGGDLEVTVCPPVLIDPEGARLRG
jgi:methylglutamate dehydrogenase subunit C